MPAGDVKETVERHAASLMKTPGVEAVAAGETDAGDPCLRVWVSVDPEEIEGRLPREIDGFPVLVERGGPFRAYETDF